MCGKVHLHHLYVTGEFLSYAQSLCNMKDKENKEFFPLFEHNMVGFNFCFFCQKYKTLAVVNNKSFYLWEKPHQFEI